MDTALDDTASLPGDGHAADPSIGRDPLTGLADRASFLQRLPGIVANASGQGGAVGLVAVDIDWFGELSQRAGRSDVARLIRGVANRLRQTPGVVLAARFDSDDFALVIRDVATESAAQAIVEAMREPFTRGGAMFQLTVSAGAAAFPADALSPTGLLRRAEVALFYAKNAGRDRAVRYERSMRTDLAGLVRASVGQGNFVLQYQPSLDLADRRRALGVEALMRWQHPQRGLLQPGAFRALFENPEVAILVGQTALDHALADCRAWMADGLDAGRLSLNLSTAQLRFPDFAEQAANLCLKHRVPEDRVVFELPDALSDLTEGELGDTIGMLREVGFGLAFPAYSLDRGDYAGCVAPGDWVKAPFPDGEEEGQSAELARLAARAKAAELALVLERVERPQQLRRAMMVGAAGVQGYAFARPMAVEDVGGFVRGLAEEQAAA